jgi:hypothetical protein
VLLQFFEVAQASQPDDSTRVDSRALMAGAGVRGVAAKSNALRRGDDLLEEGADKTKRLIQASNRGSRASQDVKPKSGTVGENPRGAGAKPDSGEVVRSEGATQCFVAGTLVATEDGLRPIEEIRERDLVWSRNEETGEMRLRPVVAVFVTPDQETLKLQLEASDGTVETLGVPHARPFWVVDKGWVGAGSLDAGDRLFTERDGWLKVRSFLDQAGLRGADTIIGPPSRSRSRRCDAGRY